MTQADELLQKRDQLEKRLAAAISDALAEFYEDTGYSIKNVRVSEARTRVGTERPGFVVTQVVCDVDA